MANTMRLGKGVEMRIFLTILACLVLGGCDLGYKAEPYKTLYNCEWQDNDDKEYDDKVSTLSKTCNHHDIMSSTYYCDDGIYVTTINRTGSQSCNNGWVTERKILRNGKVVYRKQYNKPANWKHNRFCNISNCSLLTESEGTPSPLKRTDLDPCPEKCKGAKP
jgi:hypothetical protein